MFYVYADPPFVSIKADFDDNHQRGILIADIETEWPVERVNWFYKGKQINLMDIGKRFKEDICTSREKHKTLHINNFQRSDEGEYACEVETIGGKGTSLPVSVFIPKGNYPIAQHTLFRVICTCRHVTYYCRSVLNILEKVVIYS